MHFCSSLDAMNGPPLPPPQILLGQGKVYWVVGGGGWAQLELTDAL